MSKLFILVEGYVKDSGGSVQSTVTLVQDEDINIVADPGMTKDPHAIVKALRKYNLKPDDIDYVFITHHHPDHTRHVGLFPNAKLVDFWAVYDKDQWIDITDGHQITQNTRMILTPGHTKEDASLIVSDVENFETGKNISVAICHLWWYEGRQDDPVAWNNDKLGISRKKIVAMVDYVIPGHGAPFRTS